MAVPLSKLFGKQYSDRLLPHVQEVLRGTQARDEIRDLYLATYDKLASREENEAGSAIKGVDPLSLKNLRPVFQRQIETELANAKVSPSGIVINLMNKSLLGYAGDTPTGPVQTVDILAFYLEGVQGEHAFITPKQYKEGRGDSSRGNFGGRVGGGFMMDRKHYEREAWEKITGVPFSAVRHPISNQSAFKEFDTLAKKINFKKYIDIAIQQANQDFAEQ